MATGGDNGIPFQDIPLDSVLQVVPVEAETEHDYSQAHIPNSRLPFQRARGCGQGGGSSCCEAVSRLQLEIERRDVELEKVRLERDSAREKLELREQAFSLANEKLEFENGKELYKKNEEIMALKKQNEELQAKVVYLETEKERLEEDLRNLTCEMDTLKQRVANNQNQNADQYEKMDAAVKHLSMQVATLTCNQAGIGLGVAPGPVEGKLHDYKSKSNTPSSAVSVTGSDHSESKSTTPPSE